MSTQRIEGRLTVAASDRYAIVAARFNEFIVNRLVEGAVDGLVRHGAAAEHITVVRVPGSWEIPLAVQRLCRGGRVKGVIALGALIRGATAHFDYISAQVSSGVNQAALESGVPAVFGVLTTDTIEQAIERAGTKAGNKGFEAAMAAIEMVSVLAQLDADA
ncbi:MAG: 6,7-dimethyl-8-ribityllumazine synthase [Myxococcota bacterium]